jgi:hypothetical protein
MTIHTGLYQGYKVCTTDSPSINIENHLSEGDIFLDSTILPEGYFHPKNTTQVYKINYILHNGKIIILDEKLNSQSR